jgi:competence protein ComEA
MTMDLVKQKLGIFRVVFDKYKIVFGIILSVCACICGVILFTTRESSKPQENIRFLNEQEIASVQGISDQRLDKDKLVVDIGGQVKSPGVIEVRDGVSVLEVIEQAGGFTEKADQFYIQKNINLAELVKDRQKIYIPMIGENENTSGEGGITATTSSTGTQININTASKAELEKLSGVGPATADKIIAARPYKKIEDIKKVSGIGDATFEKLKDSIKV